MGRPERGVRAAAGVTALAVVVLLGGCTAGEPEPPGTTEAPVALRLRTAQGAGTLAGRDRARAVSAVGDVLSAYVVAGYLGDYPRQGFVRAFGSFTGGLTRDAARDIEQLTAARFADADSVRATRLDARLSFLVDEGDVVGATAAVRFAFEALIDGEARPLTMDGRLMLVEEDGAWSVFGYDVVTESGEEVEGRVS